MIYIIFRFRNESSIQFKNFAFSDDCLNCFSRCVLSVTFSKLCLILEPNILLKQVLVLTAEPVLYFHVVFLLAVVCGL